MQVNNSACASREVPPVLVHSAHNVHVTSKAITTKTTLQVQSQDLRQLTTNSRFILKFICKLDRQLSSRKTHLSKPSLITLEKLDRVLVILNKTDTSK